MKQAQYRVHVPTTDNLGQRLPTNLPHAAHQWLYHAKPRYFEDIWIEGPHRHAQDERHHIVAVALDDPETDSHVKQLAAHIGEIANHPFIPVTKQGEKGTQSWSVPNRKYIPEAGSPYAQTTFQPPVEGETTPYAL